MKRFLLTLLCLGLLGGVIVRADAMKDDLDAANAAFVQGKYDESARLFHRLIETRGYSAPLLFDAGNAELKAGHLGPALLDYERARYLAPLDEAIDRNLQLARRQAGLQPDPYRWWQVVIRAIDWWVWLAGMLACLALILLAIIALATMKAQRLETGADSAAWRKFFRALLFICIPLALFLGFVELSAVGFGDRVEGVVLVKQATLRLSPFDGAESTGSIPEGELVTVEQRHNDYVWIDDRSRQSGWLSARELAPVVPGSFEPTK